MPGAEDVVGVLCPVWDNLEDAGVGGRTYRWVLGWFGDVQLGVGRLSDRNSHGLTGRFFRLLHDAFLPSAAPLSPGPVQLLGLHEVWMCLWSQSLNGVSWH